MNKNRYVSEKVTNEWIITIKIIQKYLKIRQEDIANEIGITRQMFNAYLNKKYPLTRVIFNASIEAANYLICNCITIGYQEKCSLYTVINDLIDSLHFPT